MMTKWLPIITILSVSTHVLIVAVEMEQKGKGFRNTEIELTTLRSFQQYFSHKGTKRWLNAVC